MNQAAPVPPALLELLDRLENYYDFECTGGPLKNCVEWQQLKAAVLAGAPAPPSLRERIREVFYRYIREADEAAAAYVNETAPRTGEYLALSGAERARSKSLRKLHARLDFDLFEREASGVAAPLPLIVGVDHLAPLIAEAVKHRGLPKMSVDVWARRIAEDVCREASGVAAPPPPRGTDEHE